MIGILNAYHFDPTPGNYQEEYTRLMLAFAKKVFPNATIKNYDIALGEWPKDIDECDVWFITGSGKAAYDPDPWIAQLKKWIVDLDKNKKKLIGICFGHQIIAAALGGQVTKSPKGWGVGVKNYQIQKPQPWMQPELKQVNLLFSHQDQVTKIPAQAKLLASDNFCEFQMYQIGDHILTMQGHPEFSTAFAKERLASRKKIVAPETFEKAMSSFEDKKDDEAIANWIRNFVGPL
jgi:GMP synthase-like glutamine amidotransferase